MKVLIVLQLLCVFQAFAQQCGCEITSFNMTSCSTKTPGEAHCELPTFKSCDTIKVNCSYNFNTLPEIKSAKFELRATYKRLPVVLKNDDGCAALESFSKKNPEAFQIMQWPMNCKEIASYNGGYEPKEYPFTDVGKKVLRAAKGNQEVSVKLTNINGQPDLEVCFKLLVTVSC